MPMNDTARLKGFDVGAAELKIETGEMFGDFGANIIDGLSRRGPIQHHRHVDLIDIGQPVTVPWTAQHNQAGILKRRFSPRLIVIAKVAPVFERHRREKHRRIDEGK